MAKTDTNSVKVDNRWKVLSVRLGKLFYLTVATTLLIFALATVAASLWEVAASLGSSGALISALLDAIGLTVLSLAVIDVTKYLLDEEVFRERELRAAGEARAALTKFLTIITIAVSLEAVVLIFQATKTGQVSALVFPAVLLLCVVAIGLGVYQWLSAKVEAFAKTHD